MPFHPGQSGNPTGRPRGRGDKRVTARDDRLREVSATLGQLIPDAFDGDAHALLIALYRDPRVPLELRKDAAACALRVEKPALAASAILNSGRTLEQLITEADALARKRGPLLNGTAVRLDDEAARGV
jgi:hypothetical protein